jgi:Mg2+-importing ATPase
MPYDGTQAVQSSYVVHKPQTFSRALFSGFEGSEMSSVEEVLDLPTEKLLVLLETSTSGLTSKEVVRRLSKYGHNELARKKRRTGIVEFLRHLANPLVIILLFAGIISGFLGQAVDAFLIFAIVIVSEALDVYQESRAERAAEMLKEKVTTTTTVLRDGTKQEVKLSEVVPGDIVYLSAVDIVPADMKVTDTKDLHIDQSALTGESFPVDKTATPSNNKDTVVTERSDCLFLGTSVISGTATAVVVRTGNSTEYGRIAEKLVGREPETEFERGLRKFGYLMMQLTFALVIFVFFILSLFKRNVLESLLFAAALAVGLTPELLPMIVTVNLSKGALSMSKRGVIVKRLASIENFGSMDVLCTDKTGTLTENKVTLIQHIDMEGREDDKVLQYSYLNSYYETGLKSPFDQAILQFKEIDVKNYLKIDEVPFDFTRKRVSVVIDHEKQRFMITKGAPEEIIKVCAYSELGDVVSDLTEVTLRRMAEKYHDLSSEGLRVLGVSYKKIREDKRVYNVGDESGMVFLGFIAFMDPPKETAKDSLRLLKEANIELKILTGDNELVTKNACEYLGFEIKGIALGSEISQIQDAPLQRVVENANIFARVTPSQKDRIMNALKKNGHVVGFLGDGINDAPSMKTADVGISVENAVDVAKESADIILLQKSLHVLSEGVLEGRKTFGNTMKYILMGTSSNFGNMFSAAAASVFLPFIPMLPIQILFMNLLYDIANMTLPTDNVDDEYVKQPKRWDISFVRRYTLFFGPFSSVYDFLTYGIMLFIFGASESLFQSGWFVESFWTEVLVMFVIRTMRIPFFRSRPGKWLIVLTLSCVAFGTIVPFTAMGSYLGFTPLPTGYWLLLVLMVVIYLLLVDAGKVFFYRICKF